MVTFDLLGKYGEFGNQLFQIAATTCLAKRNNDVAVFPQWRCGKSNRVYSSILKNPLDETLAPGEISVFYTEPNHLYHEIPYNKNQSIRGYFQSEKYWEGYHDFIRNELLDFGNHIKDWCSIRYKNIMELDNKVGVHIRTQTRQLHDAPDTHKAPPEEYLQRAFKVFGKDNNFVIFSDNIPLVRYWFRDYNFHYVHTADVSHANVEPSKPIETVNGKPIYDNVAEMYMLSQCDHAITTSSTFGWWGAWLIKNKDKIVVAMHEDNWFGVGAPEPHLLRDLIPESWIKIKT